MSQSIASRFEFMRCKIALVVSCLDNHHLYNAPLEAHEAATVLADVLEQMDGMSDDAPEVFVFESGARHECRH